MHLKNTEHKNKHGLYAYLSNHCKGLIEIKKNKP